MGAVHQSRNGRCGQYSVSSVIFGHTVTDFQIDSDGCPPMTKQWPCIRIPSNRATATKKTVYNSRKAVKSVLNIVPSLIQLIREDPVFLINLCITEKTPGVSVRRQQSRCSCSPPVAWDCESGSTGSLRRLLRP